MRAAGHSRWRPRMQYLLMLYLDETGLAEA